MSNIIDQLNINVKLSGIKIAFLGTPEFAVPILEKLSQSEFKPIAVFCAPDKPVGRKQVLTPPPVKVAAQKYNIPVFQPANSRELAYTLKPIPFNMVISTAYGLILPKDVLDTPKYNCLNIHPSLLPKYRGPSPIQTTILNGDDETGVTIIKMDEKIDHGPIIANYKLQITNYKFTTLQLSQKLSEVGADLLIKTLSQWLARKIKPASQDESQATYTKIIKKENGLINWRKTAIKIERQIRAFTPWPGAFTKLKIKKLNLKIIKADVSEKNAQKKIGEVFLTKNEKLAVQTAQGCLIIEKLQLENGKPMSAQDFLRGHKNFIGQILS